MLTLRLLTVALLVLPLLSVCPSAIGQDQTDKMEIAVVAEKITSLKAQLAEDAQRYGPDHAALEAAKRQIEELTKQLRKKQTALKLLSEKQVYQEIDQKVRELAVAIAKLQPVTEDETGFKRAIELLQRTVKEVQAKRAAADAFKQDAAALQGSLGKLEQKQLKEMKEKEQLALKAAMVLKQQQATQAMRNKDLLKMKEQVAAVEKSRLEAVEKARRFLVEQQLGDPARGSVEGSLAARMNRLEDELAQIKSMLKQLLDRK